MDIKTPCSASAELLPLLILHSDKRDRALGLPRPGTKTLSLLDYQRKRQRQAISTLAVAAFYKALIDECWTEVRRLIDEADTPEERRAILPDVERLNELAEEAAAELERLSDG